MERSGSVNGRTPQAGLEVEEMIHFLVFETCFTAKVETEIEMSEIMCSVALNKWQWEQNGRDVITVNGGFFVCFTSTVHQRQHGLCPLGLLQLSVPMHFTH